MNVEVVESQRETRATKAKRASSRDQMSTLEDKVERLEGGARDAIERLDVVDGRLDELESKGDELKDDVNIAINKRWAVAESLIEVGAIRSNKTKSSKPMSKGMVGETWSQLAVMEKRHR
ncbi:hypothetical protein V6N11_051719 [Hibiscus sabdariffa]|uniref:Uncharacterized protein n=1 Tax=Hibiscus sabdariffa TaxID=183260 RepID=A0ABR2U8Q6_9ROSI